jgi:hypothetical protein
MEKIIHTGGPAFPHKLESKTPAGDNLFLVTPGDEPGMSLRDYFAAKAMQGLVENANWRGMPEDALAKAAYDMANAMLKARKS